MNTRLLFNPQSDRWCQLYGSALALAIVEKTRAYADGPIAVIVDDIAHADRLESEIRFYSSEQVAIHHLPDWETLPYDVFSPHQDIISERLKTLHRLQHTGAGDIILIPVNTLLQRLCPRSYIAGKVQIYQCRPETRIVISTQHTRSRRLQLCIAGDGAWRIYRARLDHRSVPRRCKSPLPD